MKQQLYKRLTELERRSETAAHRARANQPDPEMEKISAMLQAQAADPQFQKMMAEAPPGFLHMRVQQLRAELMGRAYSHDQQERPPR
jgi:hypothetical protein